jgi:hypothetical protein
MHVVGYMHRRHVVYYVAHALRETSIAPVTAHVLRYNALMALPAQPQSFSLALLSSCNSTKHLGCIQLEAL